MEPKPLVQNCCLLIQTIYADTFFNFLPRPYFWRGNLTSSTTVFLHGYILPGNRQSPIISPGNQESKIRRKSDTKMLLHTSWAPGAGNLLPSSHRACRHFQLPWMGPMASCMFQDENWLICLKWSQFHVSVFRYILSIKYIKYSVIVWYGRNQSDSAHCC